MVEHQSKFETFCFVIPMNFKASALSVHDYNCSDKANQMCNIRISMFHSQILCLLKYGAKAFCFFLTGRHYLEWTIPPITDDNSREFSFSYLYNASIGYKASICRVDVLNKNSLSVQNCSNTSLPTPTTDMRDKRSNDKRFARTHVIVYKLFRNGYSSEYAS